MSAELTKKYEEDKLRELAKGLVALEERYNKHPLPPIPPLEASPEALEELKADNSREYEVWEGILRLMGDNPKWEWATEGIEWLQGVLADPPCACICGTEGCPSTLDIYYFLRWGSEALRKSILSIPDLAFTDFFSDWGDQLEVDRLAYEEAAIELHLRGHLLATDNPSWQRWVGLTEPRWAETLRVLRDKLAQQAKPQISSNRVFDLGSEASMRLIRLTHDEADLMSQKILPQAVLKRLPDVVLEFMLGKGFVPEGPAN